MFINPAFSALFEDGTLPVNDVIEMVHPDDRHSFHKAIRTASRQYRATVAVTAKLGRDNAWRRVTGRLTNMFDDTAWQAWSGTPVRPPSNPRPPRQAVSQWEVRA